MIDELDLYFEDHDRGRNRHRRGARVPQQAGRGGRRPPKKKKRGRSFLALFLTLLLLGGLAGGGFFGYQKVKDYFGVKDYAGPGVGEVQVQVVQYDTATDIANTLFRAGVVKSAAAFVSAANANPKSKTIETGFYKLKKQMKATLALNALLARTDGVLVNKVSTKVVITEGMITTQIYAKLAEATKLPVADFVAAAKDPLALKVPDFWFKRQDGKPQQNPPSIEGFLYPATYDFEPGADAKTILTEMVNQFLTVTGGMKFAETVQASFNISPYEALIAASIAQKEAVFAADMGGVARVLYNRAYKTYNCNCLGLDSTVNYWLMVSGKETKESGDLTYSQLHDPNNPYNTYDKKGLPPTPISNPGKDALTGAMNAPASNYFYFLAIDKDGHTAFATTYHDFCVKTHQAKANGVNIGTCNA
jgi:UPF0755 protein